MEVRDCLVQGICRVVGKLVLEITKSNRALVKIFGGLHLLQADSVLHEVIDTPTTAVGGLIIGLSSFGQRNMERGTFWVSPALFGLFAQKIRYAANVSIRPSGSLNVSVLIFAGYNAFALFVL